MNVKNLLSEIGNKIQSLPVKSDDHCIKKKWSYVFQKDREYLAEKMEKRYRTNII